MLIIAYYVVPDAWLLVGCPPTNSKTYPDNSCVVSLDPSMQPRSQNTLCP